MNRYRSYILAFISGFAVMAIEITALRIFAPYFGNTIYVWGSVIGVFLLFLSAGYLLGGWLADKKGPSSFIPLFLALAFIFLAAGIFTYPHLLGMLAKGLGRLKSLVASAVLFGIPIALLGALPPALIKSGSEGGKLGMGAGKMLAISTGGSLAGTFGASFFLIPRYGSCMTFILTVTLIGIALAIELGVRKRIFLASFLLCIPLYFVDQAEYLKKAFGGGRVAGSDEELIFAKESPYNLVFVGRSRDRYTLHLNQWGRHSYYTGGETVYSPETVSYREFFRIFPAMNGAKELLILGLGGGTSLREYLRHDPGIRVDGVENDPVVIEASRLFFGLSESPKVKVFIEDARPFLEETESKYDFIEVDTYQGNYYIPFYMATREFFKLVETRLTDNGIFAMNVVSQFEPSKEDYVARRIINSLYGLFPSVYSMRFAGADLIVGFKKKVGEREFISMLDKVEAGERQIAGLTGYCRKHMIKTSQFDKEDIFTDDRAPVENLTEKLVRDRAEYLYKDRL